MNEQNLAALERVRTGDDNEIRDSPVGRKRPLFSVEKEIQDLKRDLSRR